jgi:hypothetical protein
MIPIRPIIEDLNNEPTQLKANFFVNTDYDSFRRWLERYTAELHQHPFHSRLGWGELQEAYPYRRGSHPESFYINLLMHYPSEVLPELVKQVIKVKIIELTPKSEKTPGRIEIEADCRHLEWISPYFSKMLLEIERRWPEASETGPLNAPSENRAGSVVGKKPINLQRGKPGAKPEPLYDEAFKIVSEGSFTQDAYNKAFDWYCEKAMLTQIDKKTRDSFKAAMKRRGDGLKTQ